MAIVVVGAGAIGLLVAGRLAQADERVVLLARPRAVAALSRDGIALRQEQARTVARPALVIGEPGELSPADSPPELAVLCVKGYDTEGALATLEALAPRHILTLQNGIGNEETLIARFGAERVLSGTITTSVEVEGPEAIAVTKTGGIGLAPTAGQSLERWAALLRQAGFETRTYADYRAMKWSKALLNMLGNATAAILDMSVAAVYQDRRLVALERQAFREALAVMDRRGLRPVNLPRYPAALLATAMRVAPAALLNPLLRRLVAGGRGGKPPSLQLDLARGNTRSEAAFLYGAIAQAADDTGVRAPANHALWRVVREIASGATPWDAYRHKPDELLAQVN